MPKLANQLRRAAAELAHLERQLAKLEARTAGKRTEVARLQAAIDREEAGTSAAPEGPATTPGLPAARTDAIVEVLRRSTDTMSPSEITAALVADGREEQLQSVTATLNHLLRSRVVERPSRGRYRLR